eukprot:scaffold1134_cov295-Prasinococcus_capsulatus_cf.AAC.2
MAALVEAKAKARKAVYPVNVPLPRAVSWKDDRSIRRAAIMICNTPGQRRRRATHSERAHGRELAVAGARSRKHTMCDMYCFTVLVVMNARTTSRPCTVVATSAPQTQGGGR